jgi:hypothetical protein
MKKKEKLIIKKGSSAGCFLYAQNWNYIQEILFLVLASKIYLVIFFKRIY